MASRKTQTLKRAIVYADRAIKISRNALLRDICEGIYIEFLRDQKRLQYDYITNLLRELKPQEDWLTRIIINKGFMNYKGKMKQKLKDKTQQPSNMHHL